MNNFEALQKLADKLLKQTVNSGGNEYTHEWGKDINEIRDVIKNQESKCRELKQAVNELVDGIERGYGIRIVDKNKTVQRVIQEGKMELSDKCVSDFSKLIEGFAKYKRETKSDA